MNETTGLLDRERRERNRRRVALPSAPARLPLEELGSRGAEKEKRHRHAPVDEVLDEFDERTVGPVEVLDHDDAGTTRRHRLEEPAPGRERLLATHGGFVLADADKRRQSRREPGALRFVREETGEHHVELRCGLAWVVRLEDPRLGFHDLAERPERDALTVGQAAPVTPGDDVGTLVEGGAKLGDEAALADPRLADDRDELDRRFALGAEERLEQQCALVLASDERAVRRCLWLADAAAGVGRAPDRDRVGLPLRLDRVEWLERDRRLGRPHRGLVDKHGADRRS